MTPRKANVAPTRGALLPTERLILIPNAIIGNDDPGKPLSAEVIEIIRAMATLRYYPVDFGTASDDATELWFDTAKSVSMAQNDAERFIALGGDV